jgi:LysR family transcriptional regulator, glycine cleavage system transcriptional activator
MSSLSRIKSLQAFEATARNGSFVGAAQELSVTPAAIGQQVRALEEWLGMPLFKRLDSGNKRMVVTDDARTALEDFREGFASLDAGLRKLHARRTRHGVTVTASQAFVSKWLLPRLEEFTLAHTDIDVRLDVTDRLVDVARGEAEIGLRCGDGRWPDVVATKLMDEEVFPVCSPGLRATLGESLSVKKIHQHGLIHDATMEAEHAFPSWNKWLKAAGAKVLVDHNGLRINSSSAVIQAAINGQGIALVRKALVRDDLLAGRLIQLFPEIRYPIKWAYYVVHSQQSVMQPSVRVFRDWLLTLADKN